MKSFNSGSTPDVPAMYDKDDLRLAFEVGLNIDEYERNCGAPYTFEDFYESFSDVEEKPSEGGRCTNCHFLEEIPYISPEDLTKIYKQIKPIVALKIYTGL